MLDKHLRGLGSPWKRPLARSAGSITQRKLRTQPPLLILFTNSTGAKTPGDWTWRQTMQTSPNSTACSQMEYASLAESGGFGGLARSLDASLPPGCVRMMPGSSGLLYYSPPYPVPSTLHATVLKPLPTLDTLTPCLLIASGSEVRELTLWGLDHDRVISSSVATMFCRRERTCT